MTYVPRWRSPLNALSFGLRRALAFSRGVARLSNESKDNLFDYLDGEERAAAERCEKRLRQCYELAPLRARSTQLDYRDNLYLLDALEQLFDDRPLPAADTLRAIDVGAKNWSYVFALARFLRRDGARLELTGVEIDGHGIYPDFHARCDYAQAYAAQADGGARYRVADFLALSVADLHVVTNFYPFVKLGALLRWGLPASLFQPERMIERCLAALGDGGIFVAFNQTAEERDLLHREVKSAGRQIIACCSPRSKLVAYHECTDDRWANLVQ